MFQKVCSNYENRGKFTVKVVYSCFFYYFNKPNRLVSDLYFKAGLFIYLNKDIHKKSFKENNNKNK